jgi:hypothetical protein
MKTMTAYAAVLATGMALAPMAANAATITFEAETNMGIDPAQEGFDIGTGSGSMVIVVTRGQNTPRNPGESGFCNGCDLSFETGGLLSSSSRYVFYEENSWPPAYIVGEAKWKGGGFLEINNQDLNNLTVLTGIFAEPTTSTLQTDYEEARGNLNVTGRLTDVMIDEDLADYYGVPNRGSGEISIRASGRFGPVSGVFDDGYTGTVTFSPVPVPAALPLMLTTLAGLGLIRLRRMQADG